MKKAIPKDWIEAYFSYGVDKDNRRIFLDGEINFESSQYVRRSTLYLDSLSQEKPIELWICSEGGDEYCMFSIYDTLRTVKCPITTIATGLCMSAAPLLIAAGEKGERYATPNSWFMIHDSWDDLGQQKVQELKVTTKHLETMCRRWASLMAKHSTKSQKFWLDLCKKPGDFYFDAAEAIEYGLVDQLWDEKDGD